MIPYPKEKFKLLYADPPYKTTSLTGLCNMPIKELGADNSVLFLWIPNKGKYTFAQSGLLESWDYTYNHTIYWRKSQTVGFGHWLRGDIDEMWVCTRGNIKPHHIQTPNFLQTRSENQTRKPAEIKDLLAQVAKQANLNPRIELFSRDRTEGWQILGNELPSTTQKNLLEESESQCA